MVEITGFLIGVISVSRFFLGRNLALVIFEFAFMLALLVFLIMDIRWMELPLELMVGVGIVFSLWRMLISVSLGKPMLVVGWDHIVGFAIVSLFFLFQWFVSRGRWVGSGDIWLGGLLGAVLGWPLVGLALYFAYIIGGFIALILLFLKKVKVGGRIPFAPSLILGTFVVLWWGNYILSWLKYALE